MNLNRHNPFVVALATLVEPAVASPVAPQSGANGTAAATRHRATLLERFESLAGLGKALGGSSDAAPCELPDEATILARRRQRFPYFPYYY